MRSKALVAAFLCAALVSFAQLANAAPYVERLGTYLGPGSVSRGERVNAYSVGLLDTGKGTMAVPVPSDATIRQVLIYWQGASVCTGCTISATMLITSSTVANPTIPYSVVGVNVGKSQVAANETRATFRADITALHLVKPGSNTLRLDAGDFLDKGTNGATVYVISDQGGAPGDIYFREGLDTASQKLLSPYDATVPTTFNFPAVAHDRSARLLLAVGGVPHTGGGPNSVEIKIDGQHVAGSPFSNVLTGSKGNNWDSWGLTNFTLPAGASSISAQVFSRDDFTTGKTPAVLNWVTSVLWVENSLPECSIQPLPTLTCAGPVTNVHLNGSGSFDPDSSGSPGVSYLWSSNCTGSSFTGGNTSSGATLALTVPGNVNNPQPQSCVASLKVTSVVDGETATCSTNVSVPACNYNVDCNGVPNGTAVPDLCGVCGGDNSTCKDCAGVPNGTATLDQCGVCNGNNSTCKDCAGVPNGGAVRDACGVCNGDNSTCADCRGVPNGTTQIDQCGVCGGNNSTCKDCAGVPNGHKVVDLCGVCGGTNACVDCRGIPNGGAVVDACGVCGGNNACLDCKGIPNGSNHFDLCGVCGGDNSSCKDCAGVPNGSAKRDLCGVCNGSNACLDCKGIPNGTNHLDQCGVCGGNGSTCKDCAGVPQGTAKVDACGVCNGNNACLDCKGIPFGTSKLDLCGVCAGDNSTCKDCAGVPKGGAKLDACGVCNGSNVCLDCKGIPHGTNQIDQCGLCGGNNSSCADCAGVPNGAAMVDLCGVCGGNNACLDCKGIPFGPNQIDACGVCGGTNVCTQNTCAEQSLGISIDAIAKVATSEEQNVRRLILSLQRSICRSASASKRLISKAKSAVKSLTKSNDKALLSIPVNVRVCPNTAGCTSISSGSGTTTMKKNSSQLYSLSVSLAKARVTCKSNGSCHGSVASCRARANQRKQEVSSDKKLAANLHNGIKVSTQAIPAEVSQCNF